MQEKGDETMTHVAQAMRALQALPNVGPATARDLLRLGIRSQADLVGQDPDALYRRLYQLDGRRHDPCVLDTFTAVVAFADGQPAREWWFFSQQRKAREAGMVAEDDSVVSRIVCSRTDHGRTCRIDMPAAAQADGALGMTRRR
jgi:hypothetical protein